MLLILAVLRRPGAWKATGLTALRMVLMGGSGAVLYMLILKVFLRLYDVGLSGVKHQRCGAGHAAQSAAGPEKRLL